MKSFNNIIINKISKLGGNLAPGLKNLSTKCHDYYLGLQLKLVFSGVLGVRFIFLLLAILFTAVLTLDAITVFLYIIFKTNLLPDPVIVYESEPLRMFFVTEEQKRVFFKMMANDRLAYYREVALMYNVYQPPRPLRYWEHCPPFIPLREIYEQNGVIELFVEVIERALMVSDAFKYFYGIIHETEDVHLEDVALINELKALVTDAKGEILDFDDEDLIDEIQYLIPVGQDMRRYSLPVFEYILAATALLLFYAGEEALFAPEYVVWDSVQELIEAAVRVYLRSRRR